MNIPENNRRFGKIIYSKSSAKAKKPRNFSSYKSNSNTSMKAYDRLIQKTRKTLDECKKQLNEGSYFNNNEFYNQHKRAQLLRFNNGLAEYRYNLNPLMVSQESYENNKNFTSYNFKDMNKKIYNDLFNSKETNFENSNNINEINKLRKNNIKNEKIILEREKQIEGLLNKNVRHIK